MPCKKSLKKHNRCGRKKTLKRKQRGGGPVLPSEYFGGNSGRYSTANEGIPYINTITGNMEPISQGMENSDGTYGPKLDYYPSLMEQGGGGFLPSLPSFNLFGTNPPEDVEEDIQKLEGEIKDLENEIEKAGEQEPAIPEQEPEPAIPEQEQEPAIPEQEPEPAIPEQVGGLKRNRKKYKSRRHIRKGKNMSGGKRRKNIKKKNKTKSKKNRKRSLRKRK